MKQLTLHWGNSIEILSLPLYLDSQICPFQICYHSVQTPFISDLDYFHRATTQLQEAPCTLYSVNVLFGCYSLYNLTITQYKVCVSVCWGLGRYMPTRAMQKRPCPASALRPQPILHVEARGVFSKCKSDLSPLTTPIWNAQMIFQLF